MNHGPTASTTPRLTTSCKWPKAPKRRSNARRWKSHTTFALLPRLPVSATSPQGPPSLTPPDPVALPPPADAPLDPTRRLARREPSVSALWRFRRVARRASRRLDVFRRGGDATTPRVGGEGSLMSITRRLLAVVGAQTDDRGGGGRSTARGAGRDVVAAAVVRGLPHAPRQCGDGIDRFRPGGRRQADVLRHARHQ